MKATVYYIELTEEQRHALNGDGGGWGSPLGQAYLNARDGRIDSTNFDLLVKAATMEAENAEEVWVKLQNLDACWAGRDDIERHTDSPRSMDLGDLIVWEDGRRSRCASMGFETIKTS